MVLDSIFGPVGLFSKVFLRPTMLLWTLGFLIPLILLYLIRPKPEHKSIPSLMFILKDMGKSNVHRFFRTLFKDILFIIQFLAVLLLALSLAKPFIEVHQESLVQDAIIVMDVSASTRAFGDDRFEEIQDLALDSLSKGNIIILAHANPRILEMNGDIRLSPGDAKDLIKDTTATDMPGDVPTALDFAQQYVGPESKVTIISDFVLSSFENPDMIEARIKVLRSKGALVEVKTVQKQGDNIGIVDAQLDTGNATLELKIQNFNDAPEEITIEYNGDKISLPKNILEPKGQSGSLLSMNIPLGHGKSEITLKPKDDFMPDNSYFVSIPEQESVEVLILSNDANVERSRLTPVLQSAGDQFTNVNIRYGKPPKVPDLEHNIYVIKDIDPQFVLPGVIKNLEDEITNGAVLVVLAQPDLFSVNFRDLLPVNAKQGDTLTGRQEIIVNDSLALTRGLSDVGQVDGNQVLRTEIADGAVAFWHIATNDGLEPVLAAKRIGKGAVVYYGIKDRLQTDIDPQSYAIIWGRIVDFSLVDPVSLNIATGSVITSPAKINTPDGKRNSPVLAERSGFYQTDQLLAANLYPLHSAFGTLRDTNVRLESDISATAEIEADEATTDADGDQDVKVPKDLSELLIWIGLGIIMLELFFIKWRGDL